MNRTILICLVLVSMSFTFGENLVGVYSQDNKTPANDKTKSLILNKLKSINEYYETNQNYQADVRHLLYASASGSVIEDSFSGFYKFSNGMEHSYLLGIETIQNDVIRVSIDTTNNIISISDTQKKHPFSLNDLEQSLSQCKRSSFIDTLGKTKIDLHFEPDKYPLSRLTIEISKNRIKNIEMWHSEPLEYTGSQTKFPRTKIEYSNYKERTNLKKKYFELNHIVTKDYDFNTCSDDHFSFKPDKASVANQGHTGKRSMSVSSGSPISVSKTLIECGSEKNN
jgi:hypothetical protein